MHRMIIPLLAWAVACSACSSTNDADSGLASSGCYAAGGRCILGSNECMSRAKESSQDCNPDRNPGGAFCCMDPEPEKVPQNGDACAAAGGACQVAGTYCSKQPAESAEDCPAGGCCLDTPATH
jgi:hypothetical protein